MSSAAENFCYSQRKQTITDLGPKTLPISGYQSPLTRLSATWDKSHLNEREQTFSQHLFLLGGIGGGQHGGRERFLALDVHCRLLHRLLLLHGGHGLRRIAHRRRVLVRLRTTRCGGGSCRRRGGHSHHSWRHRRHACHRLRVHRARVDRRA